MEALQEKTTVLGRALQNMDDDHQVLDTFLALVVTFMPPTARSLTLAPLAPESLP